MKMVDRRPLSGYTISSPCELNGSGELKIESEISYVNKGP